MKKTVRSEALGRTVLVEASRKDSKEDRQKRGSWANCTRGSKSERQPRIQAEERLLGKLCSWKQVGKTEKKTVRREAHGRPVIVEASRKDINEDRKNISTGAHCNRRRKP